MRQRLQIVLAFVVLLWILEALDQVTSRSFDAYGIRPRSIEGLRGILLAPFLHGGFGHLASNTGPLVMLGLLVASRGLVEFGEATILIIIGGGLGTWLIGRGGSIHIGASGLVFGYFGYLLVRGLLVRSPGRVAVAIGVGIVYGGLVWGVLPSQPGVSWEAHLCGVLAGAAAARVMPR